MARKRKRPEHIDDLLRDWPHDPEGISVRMVVGSDGRDVIQMRVDLGILQLEATGRPDGQRPEGFETIHDYLLSLVVHDGEEFVMTDEQCQEADREFVQFYHRRVCWLALREFDRAVEDADHTLGLMDFCQKHSPDEQWTASHEQYRPFVIFHRTQAAALSQLQRSVDEGGSKELNAEAAVQEINDGLEKLRAVFEKLDAAEHFDDDELVQRLIEVREAVREQHDVGRTLQERLQDAVASEQYELAAQLRDELSKRLPSRR